MKQKRTSLYIAGGFAVAVALLIAIFLGLILKEIIFPRQTRLIIATKDAEGTYNNNPLTCKEYEILRGELHEGHTMEVRFTGEQTSVGTSDNTAEVWIVDENGVDVTDHYAIEMDFGSLTIAPRRITVISEDASKRYDGTPLTCSDWELVAGRLCAGQELEVTTQGSQTAVGESENVIVHIAVWDTNGDERTDVTKNYEIACYYGTLSVHAPRT